MKVLLKISVLKSRPQLYISERFLAMNVTVKAIRDCKDEPLYIRIEDNIEEKISCAIDKDGNIFPAQKTEGGVVVILTAKQSDNIELELSDKKVFNTIALRSGSEKLDILFDNKLFTSYQYLSDLKKPFLGPVYTKTGKKIELEIEVI